MSVLNRTFGKSMGKSRKTMKAFANNSVSNLFIKKLEVLQLLSLTILNFIFKNESENVSKCTSLLNRGFGIYFKEIIPTNQVLRNITVA